MKDSASVTAAIVWAQYGPYHFARLRAAQTSAKTRRYLGVEIASRTTTYAWTRNNLDDSLHTLCPGEAAELAGFWKVYRRAVRLFREHQVAVVFVPSYWPASSLAVLLAAKRTGAKLVMMNESHRHTAQATGFKLWIKRYLVGLFDAALVGGQPQKEYFTELGLAAERIFDGYDVVDNAFFQQAATACRKKAEELKSQYSLPSDYFLSLGRFVAKKNLAVLIQAYRSYLDSSPASRTHLVLVGSGEDEFKLRALCGELCLPIYDKTTPEIGNRKSEIGSESPGVHFYGFRQAEELPVFYSFARVFILASTKEEWGLVVNEAMACGLPILVSRVAGCAPDLVNDGKNGFRFDPEDVTGLAERLNWFGNNPAAAAVMGNHSLELAQAWNPERFAKNAERATNAALNVTGRFDA